MAAAADNGNALLRSDALAARTASPLVLAAQPGGARLLAEQLQVKERT
jgi:hypothetical protein